MWDNENYDKKVEIQKLLFPEGIRYDRKKEHYRTIKVNSIFSLNTLFSDKYKDNKKSGKLILNENSTSVHLTGTKSNFLMEDLMIINTLIKMGK